ncbi:transporter [bacterium SCSIO 12741]|nr:transporter [bacterium SCSIO 12741]
MSDTPIQDPGLGEKYERLTQRIINPDGSFNIYREGMGSALKYLYEYFISVSWFQFILILLLGYVIMNSLFAMTYVLLGINGISGTESLDTQNEFLIALFFSFQTFTTVGYGGLSPMSTSVNLVASFQAMMGFMSFSIATGLLYGRFSKPKADIVYSNRILLSPFKDGYALMFRIINMRHHVLLDMEAKVLLATTREINGIYRRTYSRLDLAIDKIDFFPLNWTVVHPIDEESPFHGKSPQEIVKSNPEVLILIKGFDETFSQVVHSRYSYTHREMVINAKFHPAYTTYPDGSTHINVKDIHKYKKLDGKVGDISFEQVTKEG